MDRQIHQPENTDLYLRDAKKNSSNCSLETWGVTAGCLCAVHFPRAIKPVSLTYYSPGERSNFAEEGFKTYYFTDSVGAGR